ncbi:hypothetical protein FNW25_01445 [Flavobacterium franklandianum]|uniref:hypothetical protein n=1 Tax=Flavobacterium franklandianum TaxID=2594430 RepID=UPI00117AF928|nr:hypothetical protein [Flavobacterium franklandianum]TRX29651.1 hypothetical protein FNW25_01445 [Flavobacterium franklandianum]
MKKIILALLFVTGLSAQTTEVEYNYLTKGYKETLEKGLDIKQGYELQDLYIHTDDSYNFDFKLFVDKNSKKTKAVLVTAVSKVWGNKYYLCIPIGNSVLHQRYYDSLQIWDKDILRVYTTALTEILQFSLETI